MTGFDNSNVAHENILSSPSGVLANTYTTTNAQVTMDSFTLPNTCTIPLDTSSTITNSNVMLSSVSIAGQSTGTHGSLQNISLLSQSPIKTGTAGNLTQEVSVLDASAFLSINQDDFKSMNSLLESLDIVESRNNVVDGTNVQYHIQQYAVQDTVPINAQSNTQLVNPQNQYVELQHVPIRVDQHTIPCTTQVTQVPINKPCYILPVGANTEFVMAKTQATAVKKTASNYIPDLSGLEGVCFCPLDAKREECPIEQLVAVTLKNGTGKMMKQLPVHIIVISMEEFVTFQKEGKLYVSVGEIVQRLIPEFKKEVENFINTDMDCETNQMSFFELQYIKQRRCVSFQLSNWMLISLTTLRRMCREFLKQKAFVRSLSNRLQNAADAPYFVKRLGKHTRCSICGGAVKMLDIADEYVWLHIPLPDETEVRCGPYDIVPTSMNEVPHDAQTASDRQQGNTKLEGEDRRIDIKHLFVSSITFHSFQIVTDGSKEVDKTYVSLKELVESRVLSIQALQVGLIKQQYTPRRAPSIVDDYYCKHSVDVDDTLWIDLLTIRCVCCMGKQSNGYSMDLYNRFGRGQWKEEVVCTILGPDDRENERKVFTLYPATYKICLGSTESIPDVKKRKKPRDTTRVNKPRSGKTWTATESTSSKQVSASDKSKPQLEDTTQSSISSTSDIYREERKKKDALVSENSEKNKNNEKEKQELQPGIYYFKNKKSVLEFLNTNGNDSTDSSPEKRGQPSTSTFNQSKQVVVGKDQFKKIAEAQTKNFRVQIKPARTPYKSSKQKEQNQQRNEVNENKNTSQRGSGPSGLLVEAKQTTDEVSVSDKTVTLNEDVQDTEENVVTSTQLMDSDNNNERVIVVTNSVMPDFTPLSSLDMELKEQQMVDTTILEPVCDSNMSDSSRSVSDQIGYHGNTTDNTNKVSHETEEIYKSALKKVNKSPSKDKSLENTATNISEKEGHGTKSVVLSKCTSDNEAKYSENSRTKTSKINKNFNISTDSVLPSNCDETTSAVEAILKMTWPVCSSEKETELPNDIESEGTNQSVSNLDRCSDQLLSPLSSPHFSSPVFNKGPMFSSPCSRDGRKLRKLYDKVASVNADESLAFLATVATECSQDDSDVSQSETEESCDGSMLNKEGSEFAASKTEEIRKTTTLKKQPDIRKKIETMLKDVAKYLLINYKQESDGLRVSLAFKEEAPRAFPGKL